MTDPIKSATDEERASLFGPHGVFRENVKITPSRAQVLMWAHSLNARIEAEKARADERIAELEGRLRRAKEHLLLVEKHQSVDWHTQELKDRFYEALEACCNDD